MGMQLRCRCGANLSADPSTPAVVCGACGATVAVPQPERELALSETVPAMQAQPAAPAKRRSSLPIVAGALAVVGAGIALVVVATRTPAKPPAPKPVVAATADAAAPPDIPDEPPRPASSVEELVVRERAAISRADVAALRALMSPAVFVHGPDANDVAYDAEAGAPIIRSLGGAVVDSKFSKITTAGDIAWIVDELEAGGVRLMTSQLAFRDGAIWRVAAWHVARLLPNRQAYDHARQFRLPRPKPIDRHTDDDQQVFDACARAFESRQSFIDAFSDRADAIDLGSAPGEKLVGGTAVKRAFGKIAATILADSHAAGRVSDRAGWCAANVGFTMTIDGSEVTQVFRVLAIFVREPAGWRIVLAQWSNAGPFP